MGGLELGAETLDRPMTRTGIVRGGANMIRFIYKYLFIKPQGMQAKASTIVG